MFKIIGADGREYGPVDMAQLRAWVREGRADARTLVQAAGDGQWKALSALPEFSSLAIAPPGVVALPPRTNGFAITGMIMGILSVTLCFCFYGFPCNLLGFIFSLVALSQIKQNPQAHTGKGMAITGLVLSIVSFGLAILLLLSGTMLNWSDLQRELNSRNF